MWWLHLPLGQCSFAEIHPGCSRARALREQICAGKWPWKLFEMIFGVQTAKIRDSVEVEWAVEREFTCVHSGSFSFPPIPSYPGMFAHLSWAHPPSFAAAGRTVGSSTAEVSPEKIPLGRGIRVFPCAMSPSLG